MIPDWKLPSGVDRGLWDYMQNPLVARDYDEALQSSPLIQVDVRFCQRHFLQPGTLIDLGCGTGRLLFDFAPRGFACTGVDLSPEMLQAVQERASQSGLQIHLHQLNLVELDSLPDQQFDYAACLFSTLGMIRGRDHRRSFLNQVHRITRATACLVLHVHNACFRLGRGLGRRGSEPGDRIMPQLRGGAELTLHHYTWQELKQDLAFAGWKIRDSQAVGIAADGRLPCSGWIPRYRAHGYLVAAEKA